MENALLLPAVAMAGLTFLVWCRLYVERLGQMRRLRVHPLHSLVHCASNRVMHRFYAYLAGALALWALWAVLAWGLLA